jgi:bifunctional DNase/RNase
MTHDLFKSFANNFHFTVEEIIISDLKEGVFFAKIVCSDGLKKMEVDARPSDAIAIGLRFDSPIFTYENILAEAGIVLTDEADEEAEQKKSEPKTKAKKEVATKKAEDFKNYSVERLNELLKDAIDKEDYERAAKIRDELSKRN